MKIAICAMCRLENRYIKEWINYYKKLGINHIYLFDNNDLNSERLIDVIKDDVDNGFVTITEVCGRENLNKAGNQSGCYTTCFNNHKKEYDWFGFVDIDEFVYLPEKTLQEFLSDEKFVDTDVIHLSWQIYGDNGNCFYEDKPVQERFKIPCKINALYAQNFPENMWVKSFVKCSNKPIKIQCHTAYVDGICRTADGILSNCNKLQEPIISWKNAYVKHYITKSFEEHIERRILHLNNAFDNTLTSLELQLKCYFNINEYSNEKKLLINFLKERMK